LCLGIICVYRSLYVFADSKDELQAWLQALSFVVPSDVRIPTVAEVAMSARLAIPIPTPVEEHKKVVTVVKNGTGAAQKVVELLAKWESFLNAASISLGFVVKRIFNYAGGEFTGTFVFCLPSTMCTGHHRVLVECLVSWGLSTQFTLHPLLCYAPTPRIDAACADTTLLRSGDVLFASAGEDYISLEGDGPTAPGRQAALPPVPNEETYDSMAGLRSSGRAVHNTYLTPVYLGVSGDADYMEALPTGGSGDVDYMSVQEYGQVGCRDVRMRTWLLLPLCCCHASCGAC